MAKTTYTDPEDKFVDKKRSNTKSDLIEITEDKLENILIKNQKYLDLKTSWLNPLSLFLTMLLAKLTADFKDFFEIPKNTWEAIFIIGIILSFIWLVWTIIRIVTYWSKSSLDYLLGIIKNTHSTTEKSGSENNNA
ncbi:MAG: hypothetical protein IPH24_15245 [Crocinitomicaceae bacterium]|nr:hypothetical protein [Crocinitomicaceae bacterium]